MHASRRFWLASAAAALFASAAAAQASPTAAKAAEDYVAKNAPMALAVLNDPKLNAETRLAKFGELFDRFADLPRIANFVIGKHAAGLRADPALQKEWLAAFRDYSLAVYQDQLDQYRGSQINVRGARENRPGDFEVTSAIARKGQPPFPVNWRVLRQTDGSFRVVDVAVNLDGSIIWLAVQQRLDFLAFLDKNKGDIRALTADVRRQTGVMRARIARQRG
jgi:phospholipid transport system substrate-binding protein